jgi:hypothetical protein
MKQSALKLLAVFAATQFLSGCVNPVEIVYSDDKQTIDSTLGGALSLTNPNSSGQLDHMKSVEFKLLAPRPLTDSQGRTKTYSSTCGATFTADADIHIRYCRRVPVKPEVIALLKNAFPQYADDLATASNLEADYRAPYEVSSLGMITRGEETWLLFNKKTGRYFFYQNARPDPKICESGHQTTPAEPW